LGAQGFGERLFVGDFLLAGDAVRVFRTGDGVFRRTGDGVFRRIVLGFTAVILLSTNIFSVDSKR
jgi:hypothetical protein